MAGNRKAAFEAYYKANPDKLKGKSIDEAYAAMRRNVVATGNRAGKTAGDKNLSAIERRLAAATSKSRANAAGRGGNSPLAKGAAAVLNSPKKIVDALPDIGYGSQRSRDARIAEKGTLREQFNGGRNLPFGGKDRKNKMSEGQLAALERRLKNKSSKGGRQAS